MDKKKYHPLETRECDYKGEHYSAREDGAIMRHQRTGAQKRKLDEKWTFGRPNEKTGYMEFAGQRVHRIVAFAFLGEPPTSQHVVDHIDTNRKNNRPINLRWLTKLENILNNEITRKKVELICGSVEAFLKNPSLLFGHEMDDKNFSWMKKVSLEEAKNCLENWKNWARTANPSINYDKKERHIGDWIYASPRHSDINVMNRNGKSSISLKNEKHVPVEFSQDYKITDTDGLLNGIVEEENVNDSIYYYDSLTPSAKQCWLTPTEFPCCPDKVKDDGLEIYMNNLKEGALFSSNIYTKYYVINKTLISDKNDLIVLCTNNDGEMILGAYALCSIRIENGEYVHLCIRRFGYLEDATRWYKLIIGEEEWTDDDLIWWDT